MSNAGEGNTVRRQDSPKELCYPDGRGLFLLIADDCDGLLLCVAALIIGVLRFLLLLAEEAEPLGVFLGLVDAGVMESRLFRVCGVGARC